MTIDPRFLRDAGREIFTGNELLVKGALETEGGVHLLTGYPGSPIASFFDTLAGLGALLNDKGIVAKLANNEALSVAMVNGAQMAGCRAITAFKSVGVHVAADALALGVLAGTRNGSGGLIICGDDPWSESTQVPADSRFIAEHVRLPMLEPSSPQEVKDWINLGFKLGAAANIYIGYMMTVALADGGGSVQCFPNHYPVLNENQKRSLSYAADIEPSLEDTVLLPPRTGRREVALLASFAAVKAAARELGVNRIVHAVAKGEQAPLGFIAPGVAYGFLTHALAELGLAGRIPILKLGLSYPVDEKIVTDFARSCQRVVVVEERRSFVERQVIEIISPLRQRGELATEIYGKQFPGDLEGIPATRGLNPSLLLERLTPLIRHVPALAVELAQPARKAALAERLNAIEETANYQVNIPDRTPTFCPGCPHRDSSNVLLELRDDLLDPTYMLNKHKRKPVDLVCHGDTGCYTMLMFEPNKPLMHNYSGMGLGGGTGSGIDPFIDNKQIVFMGDGTFFHSGQVAISHSIANGQDITYIILDNRTTAMTGHQVNPAQEFDLTGRAISAQDIERIIAGMIPKSLAKDVRLVRIDPSDRKRYRKLLEQTILADGVKVVVADKECGITFHRRKRAEERREARAVGFLPRKTQMNVATEVCEHCLECTTQTGCPGLTIEETAYGPKVQTDLSWCVSDGACHRIGACPSFEEVTVLRRQAAPGKDERYDFSRIPEPPRPIHADQETWRCHMAGVGGMGIGLAGALLVTAGHEMGYQVQFLDKKGLAIRNGSVFSQILYTRADVAKPANGNGNGNGNGHRNGNGNGAPVAALTPIISYGQADLLLGVDLLEATRAIDPKHLYRVASRRTATVVNTAKTETILSLMGRDQFDPQELVKTLRRHTHPEHFYGFNVGDVCEKLVGSKLPANIMMLGVAYQRGFLPLTIEAIEKAIVLTVRSEKEKNMRAFNIGRLIAAKPELFDEYLHPVRESSRKLLRRKITVIRTMHGGNRGKFRSRQFRALIVRTLRAARDYHLEDQLLRDVVVRAFDCYVWGGVAYAKRYCDRLVAVFEKDSAAQNFRITRAVIWNLAKVMLIKDEVFVSALLTSPEKYERDRKRFDADPARGDKLIYRHHNQPEFVLFGHTIRFEFKARDWQLRLMGKARFLRAIMPKWHERERGFRDWYVHLVENFSYNGPRDYERWLAILSTPESVTGYREVRYPKMDAARRKAEQLLATSPDLFEPVTPLANPPAQPGKVALEVLSPAGV